MQVSLLPPFIVLVGSRAHQRELRRYGAAVKFLPYKLTINESFLGRCVAPSEFAD